MTLYSGPLSMYGAKAHIAALEKGLPVKLVMVPFTDEHRYDPKHAEVVRINPKRQVPVLVHGAVEIFDSTQIFEYFEHLQPLPPLWPADPAARARARLLELKSDEVFFPDVIRLMGLQARLAEPSARESIASARQFYAGLEARMAPNGWLAGDYSYADIAFFMAQLFAARLGAPMDDSTPQLLAWRRRMTARPAVQPTLIQLTHTLMEQGRPIPPFMREAVGTV
jgi:glutathione S-transferase